MPETSACLHFFGREIQIVQNIVLLDSCTVPRQIDRFICKSLILVPTFSEYPRWRSKHEKGLGPRGVRTRAARFQVGRATD